MGPKKGKIQVFLIAGVLLISNASAFSQLPATVIIANQEWAANNLNVATFANGDSIPQFKSADDWLKAGQEKKPAWCYMNNDPANGPIFGKLYNWYAVNDPRGLAPKGWVIPNDSVWNELMYKLGGDNQAGTKMRRIPAANTGLSCFSGLPGGVRNVKGEFTDLRKNSLWWCSTQANDQFAWLRFLGDGTSAVGKTGRDKSFGLSVRCIRFIPAGKIPKQKEIKFPYAPFVKIGSQLWTTKNLEVSTFANGEAIPEAKTTEEWTQAGNAKKPAWCYYKNDTAKGRAYGKLYNWYAVIDPRGLAPKGWHIPSDPEWSTLIDYLCGLYNSGKDLKSMSGWASDEFDCSNSTGMTCLPGGIRNEVGTFQYGDFRGFWWSKSESDAVSGFGINLVSDGRSTTRNGYNRNSGLSVRCVKD